MSSDHLSKQKEWLSRAYIAAVAATAGYTIQYVLDDIDGVDAVVRDRGVTVDFQLKATAAPNRTDTALKFDLDVRTYDRLRDVERSSPGLLLVVIVPADPCDWLLHSEAGLVVRHCGYFVDLTGRPDTTNTATIRLDVPLANALTVERMRDILADARGRLT